MTDWTDPFKWCNRCGGFFPANTVHACVRFQPFYVPNPPGERPGAVTIPLLTEADVRRIVREELARAVSVGPTGGGDAP